MDQFLARFYRAWSAGEPHKTTNAINRFLYQSPRKKIFVLSRLQNQGGNAGLLEARTLMHIGNVLEDMIQAGHVIAVGELIKKQPFAEQRELLTLPVRKLFLAQRNGEKCLRSIIKDWPFTMWYSPIRAVRGRPSRLSAVAFDGA